MEESPSSDTHRHLLTRPAFLKQLNLDKWARLAFSGDITEKLFKNVSPEEFEEFQEYLTTIETRFRINYDQESQELIIKVPTATHELVRGFFEVARCVFNSAISGDGNAPLDSFGSTDVPLLHGMAQPDVSFEITDRQHPSRNVVGEIHYRSSNSIARFVTKLRRYLRETEEIMLVIGLVIGDRTDTGVPMMCILLQRDPHSPQDEQGTRATLTSFGTRPPRQNTRDAYVNLFPLDPIRGVGFAGYPLCNQDNLMDYTLRLPGRFVAAGDNDGNILAPSITNFTVDNIPFMIMSLYKVQQRVLRGFPPHYY